MKRYPTIIAVLLTTLNLYSQLNRTQLIGAYIYNFAKNSSVCNQDIFDTYNIVLISENPAMISEFKRISKEMYVNDKKINLTVSKNANVELNKACLIFVAQDKNDFFITISEKSQECKSLLVSENFPDKEHIMLNLYDAANNKILFEMNKGNIYGRGIKISDEILLMGGSIVDLAKLYTNAQLKLNNSTSKLKNTEKQLKSLNEELSLNQEKIDEQLKDLANQDKLINQYKEEQVNLSTEIENYRKQITEKHQALKESEANLEKLNKNLALKTNELYGFKTQIDKNNKILEEQQAHIKENKLLLSQKVKVIQWQRWIVLFFAIWSGITLVLLFLLLKAFRDKKKKNLELEKQKKELAEQYEILEKNKNLIESMMEDLSESNEELTATLEEKDKIQNKLVQSEKMASLGVLSAGIAHEINNPINFVHAGINSLLRDFEDIAPVIHEVSNLDVDSTDLKEKIRKIKKLKEENYFDDAMEAIPHIIGDIKLGAERTAEIVKGLRNFTRMDQESSQPLNINQALDTSLLLLKNKYKNRIEIIKNYAAGLPDLTCFPGKINQAFLNIIANAVDAIKEGGKIWICSSAEENNIIVSIKDNGLGMPDEIRQKIFDPFFTTKAVGEGTGLGLSITYGIIQDHNGHIDVCSTPNEGTEFIISLPLKQLNT